MNYPYSFYAIIVTIATYLTVAGTVATAVSQAVVSDDDTSTSSVQASDEDKEL